MVKPQFQTKNEDCFSSNFYPDIMDKLLLEFGNDNLLKENVKQMVDIAYKSGYVDAWKQAIFFTDN